MPKFITLDIQQLVPHRTIHYDTGDTISIFYRHDLSGFGVQFCGVQEYQAWNLRSINSSVGLDTYAPTQAFTLDGKSLYLESAGDETIEVLPYRSGHHLIIRAAHTGVLKVQSRKLPRYAAPNWAYEYWFSTPWTRMSEKEVLHEIATAHTHHLAPKIWLLDAGWASSKDFLSFNTELFPSGDSFLAKMTDMNLKPILWFAPYIDENTERWQFFDRNGWFAKSNNKSAVFPVVGSGEGLGSYIDFTAKDFITFLTERLTELSELGLAGIMFDFGEALPDNVSLKLETESAQLAAQKKIVGHNWYVGEIKKVLHEIAAPLGLCIISRSGWTDSYAYTGLWLGDQSSDSSRFSGLESVVWGYKTAYDANYRFIGMDMGGYFGFPTVSDYKRWLDLSVCMPFSMLHGAMQANPWEEGKEALHHFAQVRELHQHVWQAPQDVKIHFKTDQNNLRITHVGIKDYEYINHMSV